MAIQKYNQLPPFIKKNPTLPTAYNFTAIMSTKLDLTRELCLDLNICDKQANYVVR